MDGASNDSQNLRGRREFLKSSAVAACVLAVSGGTDAFTNPPLRGKKILFLGGTYFIGPVFVNELLKRNHEVTLFNRGKTNPHLFPQLEKLRGNRYPEIDSGLKPLEGDRRWDVVIDTCGYLPRIVKTSVSLLQDRVDQYIYVSTRGVYAAGGNEENNLLKQMPDEASEGEIAGFSPGALYAFRKAACDRAVQKMLPDKATIIRPFVITGPKSPDHVYFTYWPVRIQQGGEILSPGNGADLVQWIDVRDIAEWTVGAVERRHLGAYDMIGPASKTTFADYFRICEKIIPGQAKFTWVNEEFLKAHGMRDWGKIPTWFPGAKKGTAARAIATGLKYRDLSYLIKEELQRHKDGFPGYEPRTSTVANSLGSSGFTREKEAELLRLWHQEHDQK